MKRRILHTAILASLAFTTLSPGPDAPTAPALLGKQLLLQVKGTAVAENRDIDTDGDGVADTNADCFEVGLFDPASGRRIGTAVDCLSDVDVVADDDPGHAPRGWNIALTGTTFFHLPFGTLVTQGLTTVQPALQPTSRGDVTFTHLTGANGDGGVQYGTRMFRRAGGKVRLSGLVNLSNLVSDGEITFDCLFAIDLSFRK